MEPLHVTPCGDLIQHEYDDCACGPDVLFTDPDTGEFLAAPVYVHHSLDGREQREGRHRVILRFVRRVWYGTTG